MRNRSGRQSTDAKKKKERKKYADPSDQKKGFNINFIALDSLVGKFVLELKIPNFEDCRSFAVGALAFCSCFFFFASSAKPRNQRRKSEALACSFCFGIFDSKIRRFQTSKIPKEEEKEEGTTKINDINLYCIYLIVKEIIQ
uniref:Uncharacterized protein n=1 Tax=Pediastrum angulosum TaxID=271408 RepID=A0A2U8GHI8_9CHLO|nr:hypothetical protein [Pediastrum angulosum]AWI68152.1 hypothetical protein [Pediastrum angulosum]